MPVFLYANSWRFIEVGGFLAAWTIGYGAVQAIAPNLVTRSVDGPSHEVPAARPWAAALVTVPLLLALLLSRQGLWRPDLVVILGLALFGLPFAVNSPLHSYLILAYAGSEMAAEDVGFSYAANAMGRPAMTDAGSGCCGGPAKTGASACCVADEQAKADGASGCGGPTTAPKPERATACCG